MRSAQCQSPSRGGSAAGMRGMDAELEAYRDVFTASAALPPRGGDGDGDGSKPHHQYPIKSIVSGQHPICYYFRPLRIDHKKR